MPKQEKFRSFEEAVNILEEKKRENKHKKARQRKVPISAPSMKDMQKYLDYATTLLKGRQELITLLKLRYKLGWSYERIAWEFGRVKPEMVKELEQVAVKRIKDEIAKTRQNKIPILGR